MNLIWLIPLCVVSYLLGSFNFAVFLSRFRKQDIRKCGSGNPGATNMLRTFGFKLALLIFLLDALKGMVPAILGYYLFQDRNIAMYAMGLSATVGHCFPVFYRFRGGKGVATIVGVFFFANPVASAIAFTIAVIYGLIWEYGSVASFIFVSLLVVIQSAQSEHIVVSLLIFAIYLLMWGTHRKNILRLLSGQESRASLLKKLKRRNLSKKQEVWRKEV